MEVTFGNRFPGIFSDRAPIANAKARTIAIKARMAETMAETMAEVIPIGSVGQGRALAVRHDHPGGITFR